VLSISFINVITLNTALITLDCLQQPLFKIMTLVQILSTTCVHTLCCFSVELEGDPSAAFYAVTV